MRFSGVLKNVRKEIQRQIQFSGPMPISTYMQVSSLIIFITIYQILF